MLDIVSADYIDEGISSDGLLYNNFDRFLKYNPTIEFGTFENVNMPYTVGGDTSRPRMFYLDISLTIGDTIFEYDGEYDIERRWDHEGVYEVPTSNGGLFLHHYEMQTSGGSGKHASGCRWIRLEFTHPALAVVSRSNETVMINHFEFHAATWGYDRSTNPRWDYANELFYGVKGNTLS